MKKKIAILSLACVALASCAHSPVKAPCGAVKVASLSGGDCDPKPINLASNEYTSTYFISKVD